MPRPCCGFGNAKRYAKAGKSKRSGAIGAEKAGPIQNVSLASQWVIPYIAVTAQDD